MNRLKSWWLNLRWKIQTQGMRLRWKYYDFRDKWFHLLYCLKLRKTTPYIPEVRKVLIPIIRKIIPNMIAHDLIGVQPMSSPVGEIFTIKGPTYTQPEQESLPKEGAMRHVFGRGWERFYGNEWIPDELYWKLKINGVI